MNLIQRCKAGEFVVSVQIDSLPPERWHELSWIAEKVLWSGFDVVDINWSRNSEKPTPLLIARELQKKYFETIPHITVRDAKTLSMNTLVRESYAEGIRNYLVIHGDPRENGDPENAIYDPEGSANLIDELSQMRVKDNLEIYLGCAFSQTAEDLDAEFSRLSRKIKSGADFIMTQPIFRISEWESVSPRISAFGKPVLVGIWPIFDLKTATRIYEGRIAGVTLCEKEFRRLQQRYEELAKIRAGCTSTEAADLIDLFYDIQNERVAEMIAFLAESRTSQGVYLVSPFRHELQQSFWSLLKTVRWKLHRP